MQAVGGPTGGGSGVALQTETVVKDPAERGTRGIQVAAILTVPDVESKPGVQNLIRSVVCELRIPALLELDEDRPVQFQKAIRKQYPVYKHGKNVQMSAGGVDQTVLHNFLDKRRRWTVTLKATALSLETRKYQNYEEFRQRLEHIVAESRETRDSDFFTRVGLRYINELPVSQADLDGWVNPELAAPLLSGVFGEVDQLWQAVRGTSRSGKFLLQHGLASVDGNEDAPAPEKLRYVIDTDMYREDVEEDGLFDILDQLHQDGFSLFHWAIGDKARDHIWPQEQGGQ